MNQRDTFSKQLKLLRKKKGYTQAQLAQMISVTPQAVSKWETGTMPDSELLPSIANALDITIDTLFGLSDEVKKDPKASMRQNIASYPQEERFSIAYQYLIEAIVSTAGSDSLSRLVSNVTTGLEPIEGQEFILQSLQQHGFATGNLTKQHNYIFSAYLENNSYDSFFSSQEDYQKMLQLLSQKEILSILFFFLSHKTFTFFTQERIAKECHMETEECARYLTQMKEFSLVDISSYEAEEGQVYLYRLFNSLHVLAIFILLAGIIEGEKRGDEGLTLNASSNEKENLKPFLKNIK